MFFFNSSVFRWENISHINRLLRMNIYSKISKIQYFIILPESISITQYFCTLFRALAIPHTHTQFPVVPTMQPEIIFCSNKFRPNSVLFKFASYTGISSSKKWTSYWLQTESPHTANQEESSSELSDEQIDICLLNTHQWIHKSVRFVWQTKLIFLRKLSRFSAIVFGYESKLCLDSNFSIATPRFFVGISSTPWHFCCFNKKKNILSNKLV